MLKSSNYQFLKLDLPVSEIDFYALSSNDLLYVM